MDEFHGVKLNVIERIMLINNFYPEEGSFFDIDLLKKLKDRLSLTESEMKAWGVGTAPNGAITFAPDLDIQETEVRIDMGDFGYAKTVDVLKRMDKDAKLTSNHLSLYEKFVNGPEPRTNGKGSFVIEEGAKV